MNHIIHTLYLWYITFYDFSSSKVEVMNKAERSAKADTAFKVLYKIQNLMKIQRFCEDTIHDWGVGYRSDFLALWPEQGWFYHKRGVCEGTFNFFLTLRLPRLLIVTTGTVKSRNWYRYEFTVLVMRLIPLYKSGLKEPHAGTDWAGFPSRRSSSIFNNSTTIRT